MRKYDCSNLRNSAKLWVLTACAIVSICHTYIIPGGRSLFSCSQLRRKSQKHRSVRVSNFERISNAHSASSDGYPDGIKRPGVSTPVIPSAEEKLSLGISIASSGFLKNIEEYGNARMARRAVGILSKMPAYREMPKQEHYTAAIWACENSDQFKLAMSVFGEMKAAGINRVTRTYEGLISAAEKTKNWQAAIALFDEMIGEGIRGSTEACNSCIWAAEQGGRYDISLNMLITMEENDIPRTLATYAAVAYSCEKSGEGEISLHVMDLMRKEGYAIDTPVYKASIWACVKAGMWEKSLSLFQQMEEDGILQDEDCYSGAIWACAGGVRSQKAVELLKLMKFNGGEWEACLDMVTWMDREIPPTPKSIVTYQTVLQSLHDANREEEMRLIYLQAVRDNYFVPWVKGSRLADFRGYTLPVAKVALANILSMMKDGKMALFNLHIAVCDAPRIEEWTSHEHEDLKDESHLNTEPSFDVNALEAYLLTLPPEGLITTSRVKLEGLERVVLSREALAAWSLSSPFYGYDDTRNVWVERQSKQSDK